MKKPCLFYTITAALFLTSVNSLADITDMAIIPEGLEPCYDLSNWSSNWIPFCARYT